MDPELVYNFGEASPLDQVEKDPTYADATHDRQLHTSEDDSATRRGQENDCVTWLAQTHGVYVRPQMCEAM